jgi:IS5 family transposase
LIELDKHLDLKPLVAVADAIWRSNAGGKRPGDRTPWPSETMLRVLLLKRLYNLSDEQTEHQLRDRLLFLRFARIGLGENVPDSRTIWLYNEAPAQKDGARRLFAAFHQPLLDKGLLIKEGVMVDATFVEVPRQRNSREDNAMIKQGQTPPDWKNHPRQLAPKDLDARWAKKGDGTDYGYKDHVKVGARTKLIQDYKTSPASTHDSEPLPDLIKPEDGGLHADSAYSGEPIAAHLRELGVTNNIHEKGTRGHPLSQAQETRNRRKAKVRARVEHVFAFIEQSLGGIYNRCIGSVRNAHPIGLMNLCYNLCRAVQRLRPAAATAA